MAAKNDDGDDDDDDDEKMMTMTTTMMMMTMTVHACVYAYVCVCMHACLNVCMHMYKYNNEKQRIPDVHVCMHACVCANVCVCMHAGLHVCMHVGELNKLATDDGVDDEDDDTDNAFFMTLALTTATPHKWQSGLALNYRLGNIHSCTDWIEMFGHRGKTGRVMHRCCSIKLPW